MRTIAEYRKVKVRSVEVVGALTTVQFEGMFLTFTLVQKHLDNVGNVHVGETLYIKGKFGNDENDLFLAKYLADVVRAN